MPVHYNAVSELPEDAPPIYAESEVGAASQPGLQGPDETRSPSVRPEIHHAARTTDPTPHPAMMRVQLLAAPTPLPPVVENHAPAFVACPALHTAVYLEPVLRGSTPIRVVPRCGDVGRSDKVEWRLTSNPHATIATGTRVALCDAGGSYRFISRTVGPIVGADQRWITFLLSAGISAPATTQTLTVPRDHAGIPLLLRLFLFFVMFALADEHPFAPTPLPDLE